MQTTYEATLTFFVPEAFQHSIEINQVAKSILKDMDLDSDNMSVSASLDEIGNAYIKLADILPEDFNVLLSEFCGFSIVTSREYGCIARGSMNIFTGAAADIMISEVANISATQLDGLKTLNDNIIEVQKTVEGLQDFLKVYNITDLFEVIHKISDELESLGGSRVTKEDMLDKLKGVIQ